MDLIFYQQEYDFFFNKKEEWHPELEDLRTATRSKLKQVMFKILHEAELLSHENFIIPSIITKDFACLIIDDDPQWLTVLPVSENDIIEWTKE